MNNLFGSIGSHEHWIDEVRIICANELSEGLPDFFGLFNFQAQHGQIGGLHSRTIPDVLVNHIAQLSRRSALHRLRERKIPCFAVWQNLRVKRSAFDHL